MRATPMLEQYWALKREAGDAILLYRLGDFYEMFFEDAEIAAPLLGLVLTARHKDSDIEAPMCGVPQHALESYLARLVAAGKKVAISEQTEVAAKGRALVARKIVRIVTPGTIVDPERLDARRANEMAAVAWNGAGAAVSCLDLSTGDFSVLPLRDIVVFPHMIVPLFVGREKSILALEQAMRVGKQILLIAQKAAEVDDPAAAVVAGLDAAESVCD